MDGYLISYTSQSEGITFGVCADSLVSALGMLVDEFGDGVIPLFEHARGEFTQLCQAVGEAEGHASQEAPEPVSTAAVEPERVPPPSVEVPPTDAAEPVRGAGDEAADPDVRGDGGPTCVVCDTSITPDRATLSRLMHGEERCSECTP